MFSNIRTHRQNKLMMHEQNEFNKETETKRKKKQKNKIQSKNILTEMNLIGSFNITFNHMEDQKTRREDV